MSCESRAFCLLGNRTSDTMHASAQVPCVTEYRRDELQYMKDCRRAYNEAWMIAWLSACLSDTPHGYDVARQTQAIAHAIAADFADLLYQFRH